MAVSVRMRQLVAYLGVLRRSRSASIGGVMFVLVVFIAIGAAYLAPHDPSVLDIPNRVAPPSGDHLFGTDRYGRDVFSLVLHGARISAVVGISVVALTAIGGTVLGLLAGYYSKWDEVIMRVMDGFMAFPSILLALAIMAALGPRISNVVIALSIVYTPTVARVVRSVVLSIRELEYVDAARSLGLGDARVLLRHVLPNCMAPMMVQLTFIFALTVLGEASLSFLGVGAPPEVPSWGNILSEGRRLMHQAPWIAVFPGLAIMFTVLSLNLLGDGLRDILDPRLRGT